ncbi:MAG: EamA family transporter [Phyllobacteriaceae bacterium]|nr:EamA family transporter [Phyllobacteriaceae bacterium]MBA90437.1 EamA family transporter [Phyllobacteriaceae bacterium]
MLLTPNTRAALFMTLSMAAFLVNDMLTKLASQSVSMGQVMLVRGIFASAMILWLAWRNTPAGSLRKLANRMVFLRTGGDVLATVSYLVALANAPLVSVASLFQALPLAVTMGAAIVFREPVGWRRWSAIAVGFIGVLIILRPGFGAFSVWSALVLATVFFCTVRDLATRAIPADVPSLQISALTAVSVMLTGGILVLPMGGWQPMEAPVLAILLAAAVFVMIGYQTLTLAMRAGDLSASAPFRYTALVWAALFGYLVFGEVPDWPTAAGALLIIGSGIFTIYRERKRKDAAPVVAESTARTGARGL